MVVHAIAPDTSELLERLERQAAESGRLEERVESLENALRVEREARRRLAATLKRERAAAEALHQRAEQAEELGRLREGMAMAEQQLQTAWTQCAEVEHQLAMKCRPLWRKVLRRPPG